MTEKRRNELLGNVRLIIDSLINDLKTMLDGKTLETRLLLKESTFVGSSVSKCASKLQSLTTSKSTQDMTSLDSFVREMLQYKLDIVKVDHIQSAYDRQIEAYNVTEQEINEKIREIEGTIFELETQFKNAKSIRSHREQLEKKAAKVNSLPSQSQLKRKLDSLDENVRDTEASLSAMNARITARHAQFGSLLKCISDLQSKLVEENEGMDEGDAVEATGVDEEIDEEVREREDDRNEVEEKAAKPLADEEVEEDAEQQNDAVEGLEEEPTN